MSITLQRAAPASLDDVVESVATWQHEGAPVQLHPGDLGWAWRQGAEELATALRVWRRDDELLAVGMADGAVIRMAIAPGAGRDEELATRMLADLSDVTTVEARAGSAFRELLKRSGWTADEPWTPLHRDLAAPVDDCRMSIEVVDASDVQDRVDVQRAAFPSSTFTPERWHTMAAGPAYRRARCLVGRDSRGDAVAAVTAWSAGEGRPGLLEPMGVHRDHRGRGHGTAITVAAAAALRQMGCSSATVCTPSSNAAGLATYVAAGFRQLEAVTDFRRPS